MLEYQATLEVTCGSPWAGGLSGHVLFGLHGSRYGSVKLVHIAGSAVEARVSIANQLHFETFNRSIAQKQAEDDGIGRYASPLGKYASPLKRYASPLGFLKLCGEEPPGHDGSVSDADLWEDLFKAMQTLQIVRAPQLWSINPQAQPAAFATLAVGIRLAAGESSPWLPNELWIKVLGCLTRAELGRSNQA
jgi:hypothetical protein